MHPSITRAADQEGAAPGQKLGRKALRRAKAEAKKRVRGAGSDDEDALGEEAVTFKVRRGTRVCLTVFKF